MEEGDIRYARERRIESRSLVLCALVLAVFLGQNLGVNDLVGGDEGYYGVMARNVLHGVRFLANPSLSPLGPPGDKPFVYPLILAGAIGVGGVDEIPLRLVTLFIALTTGLLIYVIGRELREPRAGFFGALLYLLTPLLAYSGRTVAAETPLVAFSLAGIWLSLRGLRSSMPVLHGTLAGCCFGLAFLCKLWLVVPPLFGLIVGLWLGSRAGLLQGQDRGNYRRASLGFVPALVLTSSLQLALCAAVSPETLPHWIQTYLGFSMISRVTGESFATYWHRPWDFYAVTIGRAVALWLPVLAVGFVVLWRRARSARGLGPFGMILLLWLLPLAFFSMASVKSGQYVQPFLPALLLIGGIGCCEVIGAVRGVGARGVLLAGAVLAALLGAATQLPFSGTGAGSRSWIPLALQIAWVASLVMAALWRSPKAWIPRALLTACLLIVPVAGLARDLQLVRARDHVTGYALIAERVAPGLRDIDPTEPCFHAPEWPSMSFYTFRSGRYWESPYMEADSSQVGIALSSSTPHLFVVDPGVPGLYGGRPTPLLAARIAVTAKRLPMDGVGHDGRVYVNASLWTRLASAGAVGGAEDER